MLISYMSLRSKSHEQVSHAKVKAINVYRKEDIDFSIFH